MNAVLEPVVARRASAPPSARSAYLIRDPRVRSVPWRDLVPMGRLEVLRELLLSPPWLVASLAAVSWGWWPLAPIFSFFFFVVGIRLVHDAQHGSLGLSRRSHDVVMFVVSGLLLGSMHAVQVTHMRHHSRTLEEEDVEGFTAHGSGLAAALQGPLFAGRLILEGLRLGTRTQRRWIRAEILLTAAVYSFALAWGPLPVLYHVGAMLIGHCLTGYFLVWIVHRDLDGRSQVARTMRGFWRLPFLGMGYHLEHHLFPAVPVSRLEELARRIDRAAPELKERTVF